MRDREPRMSTSSFTQLLSSGCAPAPLSLDIITTDWALEISYLSCPQTGLDLITAHRSLVPRPKQHCFSDYLHCSTRLIFRQRDSHCLLVLGEVHAPKLLIPFWLLNSVNFQRGIFGDASLLNNITWSSLLKQIGFLTLWKQSHEQCHFMSGSLCQCQWHHEQVQHVWHMFITS